MFSQFNLGSNVLELSEAFYAAAGPTIWLLHVDHDEGFLRLGRSDRSAPPLIVCHPFGDLEHGDSFFY